MRVLVMSAGSLGDVAPYGGLAARLREEGHDVTLATHERFATLARECSVGFRPLRTEATIAMGMVAADDSDGGGGDGDGGDRAGTFEAGPGAVLRNVQLARELTRASARDVLTAVEDGGADLLLLSSTVAPLACHVAEALEIPSIGVYLQPHHPTGQFPPVFLSARQWMGPRANRAAQRALDGIVAAWVARATAELWAELGLPPRRPWALQRRLEAEAWPVCYGFSPAVVPRPPDWRPGVHIVGYWWPRHLVERAPPGELADFLDAGPPPVFVSFGSMGRGHGERLSEVTYEAVRAAGVRCVLQSGWADLAVADDDMLVVGEVPYDWLLPRTAAAVHHAGAGTTAATLKAGVPVVPVPVGFDNPFWADRLVALGVAPRRLRFKDLSAGELAAALRLVVTDPSYRRRAQTLAHHIATEDGAARVADIVARFTDPSTTCRSPDQLPP